MRDQERDFLLRVRVLESVAEAHALLDSLEETEEAEGVLEWKLLLAEHLACWDEKMLSRFHPWENYGLPLARNPHLPAWAAEQLGEWTMREVRADPERWRWPEHKGAVLAALGRSGRLACDGPLVLELTRFLKKPEEGGRELAGLRAQTLRLLLGFPRLSEGSLWTLLAEARQTRTAFARALAHPAMTTWLRERLWREGRGERRGHWDLILAAAWSDGALRERRELVEEVLEIARHPEASDGIVARLAMHAPAPLFPLFFRRLLELDPPSAGEILLREGVEASHLQREDLLPLLERGSAAHRLAALRWLGRLQSGHRSSSLPG